MQQRVKSAIDIAAAAGSGAPVHYHNHAVSTLLFGAKQWFLFPPHHQVMSHKQIHRWAAEDFAEYAADAAKAGAWHIAA